MPSANGVTFHPFAERFPLMSDQELSKLAESIKKHGLRVPLVRRASDGIILDGRNRYRACQEAGVEVRFEDREVDEAESLILISDLNIPRRHLTDSQKAMLAAEFSERLQKAREKPATELAEPGSANSPKRGRPEETGAKKADAEAASQYDVSDRTIRDARKVKEKSPELAKKVEAGEVSVKQAAKQVREAEKPHVAEKVPTDELGVPLTQSLLLPFQAREKFKEALAVVRKLESLVDEIAKTDGGESFAKGLNTYGKDGKTKYKDADLGNFKNHVQFYQPYSVCPYCTARAKSVKAFSDCKVCGGLGWVTKSAFESAPKDYREAVEALAAK